MSYAIDIRNSRFIKKNAVNLRNKAKNLEFPA